VDWRLAGRVTVFLASVGAVLLWCFGLLSSSGPPPGSAWERLVTMSAHITMCALGALAMPSERWCRVVLFVALLVLVLLTWLDRRGFPGGWGT
jgi:hypothetical protein